MPHSAPSSARTAKLLAFAQARDALGSGELTVEFAADETPRAILGRMAPQIQITALRIAVDGEYWDWDKPVGNASELALIPPVSGG